MTLSKIFRTGSESCLSQWKVAAPIFLDSIHSGTVLQGRLLRRQYIYVPSIRVARWYVFRPKIPLGVNFGGSCNLRCWYILWTFSLFHGHSIYFMAVWYIFPVLVCCSKKNLATLPSMHGTQKRTRDSFIN
jgi:hypothetical protein